MASALLAAPDLDFVTFISIPAGEGKQITAVRIGERSPASAGMGRRRGLPAAIRARVWGRMGLGGKERRGGGGGNRVVVGT